MNNWHKLLGSAITLGAMSPFLLALSMPVSKKVERDRLREAHAHFDVPLIVMSLFRIIIASAFVVYVLSTIYGVAIGISVGIAVFVLLIVFISKRVGKRLHNIESKFLNNLNERELRKSGKNNNLVSDLHLAYMQVGLGCSFVGQRLMDSDLRKRYGVNISSIQRGGTTIPVPKGETRIYPGDILGVIGNDEQLQKLLPVVEAEEQETEQKVNAANFKLTNVQLSEESPLLGKTSASASIRNKYSALVVAIQRGDEYLKPNGELEFEPHDIIWLVGDPRIIAQLK